MRASALNVSGRTWALISGPWFARGLLPAVLMVWSVSVGQLALAQRELQQDETAQSKSTISKNEDIKKLDGEWAPVHVIYPGLGDGDLSSEEAESLGLKWKFEKGFVTLYRNGNMWGNPYEVILQEDANPKTMDLVITGGRAKGRSLPGIYELDGDKFRIRYAARVRPKSLEGPVPRSDIEWTFERKQVAK